MYSMQSWAKVGVWCCRVHKQKRNLYYLGVGLYCILSMLIVKTLHEARIIWAFPKCIQDEPTWCNSKEWQNMKPRYKTKT